VRLRPFVAVCFVAFSVVAAVRAAEPDRRLVDAAQDCIILEPDCGTKRGLTMRAVVDGGDVIEPLSERVLGRSALEDIVDPLNGNVICKAGTLIDEVTVEQIDKAGLEEVRIRSV